MDEIISIINEWDPINLLDICPTDEYQPEIKQIASVISRNNKMNYIDLGKIIYGIFVDSFGEEFSDHPWHSLPCKHHPSLCFRLHRVVSPAELRPSCPFL